MLGLSAVEPAEQVTLTTQIGLQQAKSARARDAILEATIQSLVEVGYSETSLNRVAQRADFSKGALQHHFSSKEELIAQTVDRLLSRSMQTRKGEKASQSVEQSLRAAWRKMINTDAYMALMEILNAARTDSALRLRISEDLLSWGSKLDQQTLAKYEAVSGDPEDAVMLLNMTRSFLRGLLVQEHYGVTASQTNRYVEQWISMIAPLIALREPSANPNKKATQTSEQENP